MKRERLTQDWNLMYEALLEYRTKYNDTIVPLKWDDDPALGEWVQNQRQLKARMRLLGERVQQLDDVEFVWDITCTDEWRYEELKRYKDQHGHTLVPTAWPENPSLAEWVQTRRALRRKGKISHGHEMWLNKLEFTWDATFRSGPRLKWHQRYEQLQSFKSRFGHCMVPQNWGENKQLGHWVCQQRANRQSGKLSKEHLRLLDEIKFVWNAAAGSSEAREAAKAAKGGPRAKGASLGPSGASEASGSGAPSPASSSLSDGDAVLARIDSIDAGPAAPAPGAGAMGSLAEWEAASAAARESARRRREASADTDGEAAGPPSGSSSPERASLPSPDSEGMSDKDTWEEARSERSDC